MQLTKASDLGLPHISGTVQVSLAELDKMRTDHAMAVKLAKELEDKQALVKIVYFEQTRVFAGVSRDGDARYKNVLEEKKVEYKNFEDFRSKIAEEERARVSDQLKSQQDQITEIQQIRQEYYTTISEQKEMIVKLKSSLQDLADANSKLEEELSLKKQDIEEKDKYYRFLIDQNTSLQSLLNKWMVKKSFWHWLINKF